MKKQFGIITTGGDCPGLNAVIYSVFKSITTQGAELIGIYQNPIHSKEAYSSEKIEYLHPSIISRPGTFLGSMVESDVNYFDPQRFTNMEKNFFKAIEPFNLSGLFVLGGDGSIKVAQQIYKKIPIIVIPKTIDNDVAYTDYAIGFRSAIETTVDLLDNLKSTGGSHKRVMIAEVMGRDTGFIALESGIAAFADAILIPEKPCDLKSLKHFLMTRYEESKTGVLIVIAEGVSHIKDFIKTELPLPSRYTTLGHLQRGGKVSAMDRIMAAHMGSYAVDIALKGLWDQIIIWRDQTVMHTPLSNQSMKRYVTDLKLDICKKLGIFI